MKVFQYHPMNFAEVLKLMRKSLDAMKPGQHGRIMFNETLQRFEFYEAKEVDNFNKKHKYGNVYTAINQYKKPEEAVVETPKSVLDEASVKSLIEEAQPRSTDAYDYVDTEDEEDEETEDSKIALSNDDPEVTQNSLQILSSLVDIKQQVNQEHQNKLIKILGDMFKLDFVSESDILRSVVESSELKKVLSHILANFGVSVSLTQVSTDFKVSTGTIVFNQNIEYDVQAYRRGALEIAARVNEMKEAGNELAKKQTELEETRKQLEAEKKAHNELKAKFEVLNKQKNPVRELHSEAPIYYVVGWKDDDNNTFFISTEKGAEATKEGSYPTKHLRKTKFITKAQKFANNEAKLQIAKIIQFRNNVTTLDIEGKTKRELSGMFDVMRVIVEKVEKIENEPGE